MRLCNADIKNEAQWKEKGYHLPEFERLREIFKKDSLQMVSFTITEKGYSLVNRKGVLLPEVEADCFRKYG